MKAYILVLLHVIIVGISSAQINSNNLYLTNYTIQATSTAIGFVKVKSGDIKSVHIGGSDAKAFHIDNQHQLLVYQNELKENVSTFDISITVQTSSETLSREFIIVKDQFIRNKVIAHRGAWKNATTTENSLFALNNAFRLGCEGSEFDVHMSADSVPVIHHDPLIKEISIAKSKVSDLLTIKLANGETLPTLEVYLKAGMIQNRTKLILEIKPSELGKESSIALARKVVTQVETLKAQAWVDYISFDYDICKEVIALAPYAKVSYLNGDKSPAELAAAKFFGLDYHFNVFKKNPDWIKEAHSQKLTVNVWTVNEKSALEDLLNRDVDFITTNEPELLLSILKSR